MGRIKSLRRKQIARQEKGLTIPEEVAISGVSENDKFEARISLIQRLARSLVVEVGSLMLAGYPKVAVGFDFYEEVRRFEIGLIRRALLWSGGHQRRAASLLGLQATTLNSKIKQYEIKVERNVSVGAERVSADSLRRAGAVEVTRKHKHVR